MTKNSTNAEIIKFLKEILLILGFYASAFEMHEILFSKFRK